MEKKPSVYITRQNAMKTLNLLMMCSLAAVALMNMEFDLAEAKSRMASRHGRSMTKSEIESAKQACKYYGKKFNGAKCVIIGKKEPYRKPEYQYQGILGGIVPDIILCIMFCIFLYACVSAIKFHRENNI